MSKPVLADIDWGIVPEFPADSRSLPVVAPRLIPEVPPPGTLVTVREAGAILGLTRSGLRKHMDAGRLQYVGKNDRGEHVFDRAQVDELASDRDAKKADRMLTGSAAVQKTLEQTQGLNTDPRTMDRDARAHSEKSERVRLHQESIAALHAVRDAIEDLGRNLSREMRATRLACEATQASISALNVGLLAAGLGAAVVAVAPDDVKARAKATVDGFLRPNGPNGEAAQAALALTGPAVREGAKPTPKTIGGEILERPALSDDEMKTVTSDFQKLLESFKTTA